MKKKSFFVNYFRETKKIFEQIESYEEQILLVKKIFENTSKKGRKVIIVGNGGSAAIASHVSVDLSKNANIRSVNFNDADLITCLSNDYSYEDWIISALKMYVDNGDVVILISSSGRSKNHIKAASFLIKNKINLITFTGNDKNNLLKKTNAKGINFWIDSKSYNLIEISHLYILLMIVDLIIGRSSYSASRKIKS